MLSSGTVVKGEYFTFLGLDGSLGLLKVLYLLKLTVFCCHTEPKGEASGLSRKNCISSWARFFATLRMTKCYMSVYINELRLFLPSYRSV